MKINTIKTHLMPYSIYNKRKTTINNAFASALAPCDEYDPNKVLEAMNKLGQSTETSLTCIYCDSQAQTWDHLVGLVKDSKLRGFGHQVGNLVPCCKTCNSKKGGRDWRHFLKLEVADEQTFKEKEKQIEQYIEHYAVEINLAQVEKLEDDWQKYNEIHKEILGLMKETDSIAIRLRKAFHSVA